MQAMQDPNQWFRFVAALLAVWRITHLLAAEDGPWDIIVWLRRKAGSSILGKLMDCFYCLSLWISIPFCFYAAVGVLNRIVVWLALSGAASLLHQLTNRPEEPEEFNPFAGQKQPPEPPSEQE
jgi:predicted acyltransferase